MRKTSRALIVEEDWSTYGVGAELAARIQAGAASTTWTRRSSGSAAAEVPMPYSKPLELAALPLEAKIEAAARRLLASAASPDAGGSDRCPKKS